MLAILARERICVGCTSFFCMGGCQGVEKEGKWGKNVPSSLQECANNYENRKKDLEHFCFKWTIKERVEMEEKENLKDLSDEVIREMNTWNTSNPDATFLEIEVKARELVSKLEARLIQDSVLERERDDWSKREEKERPTCPNCHVLLISRGKRVRHLQGTTGREIQLKRTYGTCPNCGTGFFPPR